MKLKWNSDFDVRVDGVRVRKGDTFEPSSAWLKKFATHVENGNATEVRTKKAEEDKADDEKAAAEKKAADEKKADDKTKTPSK